MADPTIQTFCCHHSKNGTDMAVQVMDAFNTYSYNVVCVTSSIIGILGALYQILPREETDRRRTNIRGRQIVVWLAVADLLASLGVLVRSLLWMNFKTMIPAANDTMNVLFCAITSAWTQYFYTATWLWTLCYAIDTLLLFKYKEGCPRIYHSVAWGIPAALTSIGLSILYYPNANCHNLSSLNSALMRVMPNYLATYLPILVVMVANPVVYFILSRDVEEAVSMPFCQMTNKERNILYALRLKFAMINISFYLCWLPNIINGVLLWTLWFHLPVKVIIVVWYIMAVMNPLQALLNSIVYRRWTKGAQKIKLNFLPKWITCNKELEPEKTPLLSARLPSRLHLTENPLNSINGSSI